MCLAWVEMVHSPRGQRHPSTDPFEARIDELQRLCEEGIADSVEFMRQRDNDVRTDGMQGMADSSSLVRHRDDTCKSATYDTRFDNTWGVCLLTPREIQRSCNAHDRINSCTKINAGLQHQTPGG